MTLFSKDSRNGNEGDRSGEEKFGGGCGLMDLMKMKMKKGGTKNKATRTMIAEPRQIEVQRRNYSFNELESQADAIVVPVNTEAEQQQSLRDKRVSRRGTQFIASEATGLRYEEDMASNVETAGVADKSDEGAVPSMAGDDEQQLESDLVAKEEEVRPPPIPARSLSRPKPYLKPVRGSVQRLASSIQNFADVASNDTNPDAIRQASREVRDVAEVRDMEDLFEVDVGEGVTEEDIEEILAGVSSI